MPADETIGRDEQGAGEPTSPREARRRSVRGASRGNLSPLLGRPPGPGAWTRAGGMRNKRAGDAAALLPDGTVLVAGGASKGIPRGTNSVQIYHPRSGRWTAAAPMAHPRAVATAVSLSDGRVMVAG